MTDITEADHDAVDWLYEMGVIAPHHLRLANEAFARHREQAERQAVDRIEALEAKVEGLRGALKVTHDFAVAYAVGTGTLFDEAMAEARAALGEK